MKLRSAAIIALICLAAYSNAFHSGFLQDDYPLILAPDGIKSFSSPLGPFFRSTDNIYRPVAHSLIWLVHSFSQLNPYGYHAANLVIFIAVCVLFYVLLYDLFKNECFAFVTACFYAAHPINGVLVNYKTSHVLSIFVLLMQLGFIAFGLYWERNDKRWIVLSLIFYFAALFSHEMAAILPAYLFLAALFVWKKSLGEVFKFMVPYGAVLIGYLFLRSHIDGIRPINGAFLINIPIEQYGATLAQLIFWYISKLIYPVNILLVWDTPLIQLNPWLQIVLFIALLGSVFYWIWIKWQNEFAKICFIAFILGLAPVALAGFTYAHIYGTGFIESHWLSFAAAAFCGIVSALVLDIVRANNGQWIKILPAALIAVLIYMTWSSNLVWKDEKTYCQYWLSVNPADATARMGLARVCIQEHFRGYDPASYPDREELRKLIESCRIMKHDGMADKLSQLIAVE